MTDQTKTDMTVANTILAQLGGNRFTTMTGARNLVGGESMLQFQLPRGFAQGGDTAGIKSVRITLKDDDSYTVEFFGAMKKCPQTKARVIPNLKATVEDVYAENLRAVLTRHTGLDCTLGRAR